MLLSRSGIQQGDPLMPLLHCLATVEAHRDLNSELKQFHLDDDVICGPFKQVLQDFLHLDTELRASGLEINAQKCEVFSLGGPLDEQTAAYGKFNKQFPLLPHVNAEELTYLGAPLSDEGFASIIQQTTAKVAALINKTIILPAHQAYFLVKSCSGLVKLVYLLQTSREHNHTELLHSFDEQMRLLMAKVFNALLFGISWLQATLPITMRGLGIRLTMRVTLPAFLALVFTVRDLACGGVYRGC